MCVRDKAVLLQTHIIIKIVSGTEYHTIFKIFTKKSEILTKNFRKIKLLLKVCIKNIILILIFVNLIKCFIYIQYRPISKRLFYLSLYRT